MNREKSVQWIRLGEDTVDHIIYINIDGPSQDNFDTEKFVFDWIEPTCFMRENKIKTMQDYFVCIYLCSYLDDVELFFSLSRYELLDYYKRG